MADMFHFGGTSAATSDISNTSALPAARRQKPLRPRSRILVGAAMPFQDETQARMARVEEPLFYPTSFCALLARLGQSDLSVNVSDSERAQTREDILDEDEDAGGVPLPLEVYDRDLTKILPSTSSIAEQISTVDTSNSAHPHADYRTNVDSSAGRLYHPRPSTQFIEDAEESRRLRFALEDDTVDELPLFDGHAAPPWTDTEPTHLLEIERHPFGDAQLQNLPEPFVPEPAGPTLASILQGAWPNDGIVSLDHITHEHFSEDQDSLPVDDPKRSYNVADFLDTWRHRAYCGYAHALPAINLRPDVSIRDWQQPCEVRRQDSVGRRTDIQGIDWELFGTTRCNALRARRLVHPFARSTRPHLYDEGEEYRPEVHYRFKRFNSKHRTRFEHYQLRNVLAASTRNDVLYATGSRVVRTSLACPDVAETSLDLAKLSQNAAGFRVTALAAASPSYDGSPSSENVVIAGGFYGEYALLNLDSNDLAHTEGFVSHAYNAITTHVHTIPHRRSGVLGAVFCSNDTHVRRLDIAANSWLSDFSFEHSVNCAATAPDGRLMALVGDSNDAYITDAEKGEILVVLKEHNDHGFACAWSPDSRLVATGAQDGKVSVWDTRNWSTPMKKLTCDITCARSLHFTHDGSLLVAESDDIVSIYDTSDWTREQDLRFFGSIAGVAVLEDELIVANADKDVGGLLTFERTNRRASKTHTEMQRAEESSFACSNVTPGRSRMRRRLTSYS